MFTGRRSIFRVFGGGCGGVCGELFGRERLVVTAVGRGAGLAEDFFGVVDFAIVIDSFAAEFADDASGFVAGHLAGVDRDGNPLFMEEVGVGEFAVGEHLLLVFVFDVGIEVAGALTGRFEGCDADGFVGWRVATGFERGSQIDEGGGHLAPVAEFDGAFAEAASGDDGDGIGGAAVDLYEGDEAFAIFGI